MNSILHDKQILVAEDEHFMRVLIIQALNSLGFDKVHEAEHGKHALQIMAKHPIDIVMCDIEMEPLNGLELVKMIRSGDAPIARDSRVIVLTGLSDTTTLTSTLELDVQGFLVKPVCANDLLNKIISVTQMEVNTKERSFYQSLSFTSSGITISNKNNRHVSDMTVKPVATPIGAKQIKPASTPGSSVTQQLPSNHRMINVEMLRPGMVVFKDILARGVLLLRKGIMLELEQILVLKDMQRILDSRDIEVLVPATSSDTENVKALKNTDRSASR
jgi:YesN/AraC family two-component response regulator